MDNDLFTNKHTGLTTYAIATCYRGDRKCGLL